MNCTVTWKRLKPDTLSGEKIEVKMVYSSMNKDAIDNLEKEMAEKWGRSAIVMKEVKVRDKE